MDESIPTDQDAARRPETVPCVLAGRPATRPTDVREDPYLLPVSLEIGDKVLIEAPAYTATYSSVAFNGFER